MDCAYFAAGRCRSCNRIATPYQAQLAAKQAHAQGLLSAWPAIQWLPAVASSEAGFRNKAKMVVSGSSEAPVLGILDEAGHGVDLAACPLYPPALQASFEPLRQFIQLARIPPYDLNSRRGELKYLLLTLDEASGALMVRLVLRSREPEARIRKHLPALLAALPQAKVVSLNIQPEHKAVLEGELELVLSSDDSLTMTVAGLPLHLKPRSFFQVNSAVAGALYSQAAAWVAEAQPREAWDLFCGVGGFALAAARLGVSVTGIEVSSEAIASASRSAAELGLAHARFRALDATDFALAEQRVPELVIVNPPRRGIGAPLARFLDQSQCRTLIYSSCNAESLVRDLAAMPGFTPVAAQLLDMFPHTDHYELLLRCQRQ